MPPGIPPIRNLPMPRPANYRRPTGEPDRTSLEDLRESRPAIGRRLDLDRDGRRIDARLRPGAFKPSAAELRQVQRLFAASAPAAGAAGGAAAMGAAAECVDTPPGPRLDLENSEISIPLPRSFPFSDPVQLVLDLKAVHRWLRDFFAKTELQRKRDIYLEPRRQALVQALESHVARAREVLGRYPGHGTDKIIVDKKGTKVVRDSDAVDAGKGLLHIVSSYLDDLRSRDAKKMSPLWPSEEIDQFVNYLSDPSPALTFEVWLREAETAGPPSLFLARMRAVFANTPEASVRLNKIVTLKQHDVPEGHLLLLLRLIELRAEGIEPLLVKDAVMATPRSASHRGPKRMQEAEALLKKGQFTEAAQAYNVAGDGFIVKGLEFRARKAWLAEAEAWEAAGSSVAAERAMQKARRGELGLLSEIDSLVQQARAELEAQNLDAAYDLARIAAAKSRSIGYLDGQKTAENVLKTIRKIENQERGRQNLNSRERFEQANAQSLEDVAALINGTYQKSVAAADLERAIRAIMPGYSRSALFRKVSQRAFKIVASELTENNSKLILTIMHEYTGDTIWTVRATVGFVSGTAGRPDVLQLTKLENPRRRKSHISEDPWGL